MPRFFIESRLSPHISETPEGFLICEAVPIARAGELRYQPHETPITPGDGDTIIRRTADVIQAAETIASFEGKPVTLHHPDDFVTPETWKELAVGVVQNVRPGKGVDSDKLLADLLITDAKAIEAVKSGRLREVSCGYEAEYIEDAPGEGRQANIRGNHVALVQSGRCGSECAIFDHAPKENRRMSAKQRLMRLFGKALDAELPDDAAIVDADMGGEEEIAAMEVDAEPVEVLGEAVEVTNADPADISERLARIEEMLQRLLDAMQLGAMDSDEEVIVDSDEEVIIDADEDLILDACSEETTDADTIARAEILAPGIAKTGNVKRRALRAAYSTKDGRDIINTLTRGSGVTGDVDTLFIAASELMRGKNRAASFARASTRDADSLLHRAPMTPEMLNKKYAEFYAQK